MRFVSRCAGFRLSGLTPSFRASLPPTILPNLQSSFTRGASVYIAQRKRDETSFTGPNEQLDRNSIESKLEKRAIYPNTGYEEASFELRHAGKQINRCIRSRDYAEALNIFEATPDPDVFLCNIALHACAQGVMYREAWKIWDKMLDKPPDAVSYSIMIDLCARAKKPEAAEQLLDEMKAAGISPNLITVTSLMKAYSMSGRLDELQDVFETVRTTLLSGASIRSKQSAFSVAMSGFARAGDYARCREIFIAMLEMRIPPNHAHVNALMTACALGSYADIAQTIFESMEQYSLKPRIEDYTILLSCHRQNLRRSVEIYEEAKQAGLRPNSQLQQQMLEAYVLSGERERARSFLEEATLLDRSSTKVRELLQHLE